MRVWIVGLVLLFQQLPAQEVDGDLLRIKERLDSIVAFSADLQLELDVAFIRMPTKHARVVFEAGKPLDFVSEDFLMIPRRGLDLSLNELFKYPFLTVDRGAWQEGGIRYRTINVIPTDPKADLALATLVMDVTAHRIVRSEVTTKKEGTYQLQFEYAGAEEVLPRRIAVSFELERLRIPLNFMGKEAKIDRKKLREAGPKTGKIFLTLRNYELEYAP